MIEFYPLAEFQLGLLLLLGILIMGGVMVFLFFIDTILTALNK
jgi:hypothetical protein